MNKKWWWWLRLFAETLLYKGRGAGALNHVWENTLMPGVHICIRVIFISMKMWDFSYILYMGGAHCTLHRYFIIHLCQASMQCILVYSFISKKISNFSFCIFVSFYIFFLLQRRFYIGGVGTLSHVGNTLIPGICVSFLMAEKKM